MRDDPTAGALVARARDHDKDAWDAIVERYAPMVWSICTRAGLGRADVDDVAQTVWLTLVESLGDLRDPAALPTWLAKTAWRECRRALARANADTGPAAGLDTESDAGSDARPDTGSPVDRALRNAALVEGFRQLAPDARRLLSLLMRRPPVPLETIGATLGMPVEAIASARERCLDELRRSPAVAVLIRTGPEDGGGRDGNAVVER
ncbi:RNA polymerase sigma factor [Actinomadura fibrosa]|uniref:RNA polymerase sigma factor n=1 Tax=Actinomadura fibrosa TaxID=111802 RepID=A0ABW2XN56_9ACTN|nr:sigma-70 family RNA polymerase sigma factor [Actinomadura fibrosa]